MLATEAETPNSTAISHEESYIQFIRDLAVEMEMEDEEDSDSAS
jgi:hypothetical protein